MKASGLGGRLEELRAWLAPRADAPPIPDHELRPRSTRRLRGLGAFFGLLGLAVVARSAHVMLVPDDRLEHKARVQFEQVREVRGRRGDILDRNHRILATSVDLVDAHVDPSTLDEARRAEVSRILAEHLGTNPRAFARRLADTTRRDVVVARQLTPARWGPLRAALAEAVDGWQGASDRLVYWSSRSAARYYPARHEAVGLLGLVTWNGKGSGGVEEALDHRLRGGVYRYLQWRDRLGRRVSPETPDVRGGDSVVLSLDARIQDIAEEALDDLVERSEPHAAVAVVVDVRTGELLALANRPTANPNDTAQRKPDLLRNRAVTDIFEPGSVFKPFIAAAAVEEGLVTPDSPIDCEGGVWLVGRRRIKDDHPHGVVPFRDVIKYSSNIGAAKTALRLGPDKVIAYLRALGFGRRTGIGLPGERSGFVRDPARIKPIELATTAYGHGVSVTALQLAYAVAALGNGGVRMKPLLVREILDEDGDPIERTEPEAAERVVGEDTARAVVSMMESVTEPGGTGTRARVPGYRVAGKTGTADKYVEGQGYSPTDRVASFIGLAPADDPRLAIVVSADTPTKGSKYGGIVAAPAFARIAGAALPLLGVAPDPALLAEAEEAEPALPEEVTGPPVAIATPDLTWTAEGSLRLPDLRGLTLRDSLAALQGAGLGVTLRGWGVVVDQSPPPGGRLRPGQTVELVLE